MSDGEEQINPKAHRGLLEAIGSLGRTQHIRRVTRNEPLNLKQDEFQLMKGVKAPSRVAVNDIVKVLRHTKKHLNAGKQLKNVQSTKNILSKPLEKPAAERIKRTLGYEKAKKTLSRWDAIVAKNRSAEQQVFPLQGETIFVDTAKHSKAVQLSHKSELMLEMEAAEAKLKAYRKECSGDNENEEELAKREDELLQKKLTRDELIAKRKELSYLKIRESQKSAKARLQNRIKSKKYHKLLKRHRLQEQLKEFETLQKTNPEAALEKLNALEKHRVLERASLRHKNTGTWAKNLQVRAKYDREVRQDLAEQLQKSRELTQKQVSESDGSEDEATKNAMDMAEEEASYDPFNPWTKSAAAKEGDDAHPANDANWRKYWLERNKNEQALTEFRKDDPGDGESELQAQAQSDVIVDLEHDVKPKKKVQKRTAASEKKKPQKKKENKRVEAENGWIVEEIDTTGSTAPSQPIELNIDDIFDAQEDKVQARLNKKMKALSRQAKQMNQPKRGIKKKQVKKNELKNLQDLSFKNDKKRPQIDEALNHEELNGNKSIVADSSKVATAQSTAAPTNASAIARASTSAPPPDTIDPTKLTEVKLKPPLRGFHLIDDALDEADIDDVEDNIDAQRQMMLSEAFEDDDIIADFTRDKTKDSELKNAEIQLYMPGWGSWAGAGISAEKADSNKRFILDLAKKKKEELAKRRDENMHGVYINENVGKQLRTHLVSDLPFPFTSTQEYEASIRAPLGRNFVPETAFRVLTRPPVITRKGKVIEPMDESELVKPTRRPRLVVDRRIERAAKAAAGAVKKVKG